MPRSPSDAQLHPLFLNAYPGIPLSAELFEYSFVDGFRALEIRWQLARTTEGSIYLGLRPPSFQEEPPNPVALVIVWDLVEQTWTVKGKDVPGIHHRRPEHGGLGVFRQEPALANEPSQVHLGFQVRPLRDNPDLFYSEVLQLALFETRHFSYGDLEWVIQAVSPGAPDLSVFALT